MDDLLKWSPFAKSYDPLQSGSIDGTDTIPHDRALIRAMEAKFIPTNKGVTPNESKTLFVGRLDLKTTVENLKHEFLRYGAVTHCQIVKDVVTGFSRGYAFIQFKHREDAEKARREAHHIVLDGREILVEWENGRTMPGWIPRRLGGGFGGKKESGQLRFGGRDRPFRKPIVITPMRRDRPPNWDEDDVKTESFEEGCGPAIGRDKDVSEGKPRTEDNHRNGHLESHGGRSNIQSSKENFSKPWNRRNAEGWAGSSGQRKEPRKTWRDEEDKRYVGKPSLDRSENDYHRRDRKYSSKSSRDRVDFGERDRSYQRRSHRRSRSRDRDDRNDWEDFEMEERKFSGKYSEELEGSKRLHERGDTYRDDAYKERQRKKTRSRRSKDREYNEEDWGDFAEAEKEGKRFKRSVKDREDGETSESQNAERLGRDFERASGPSKDHDTDSHEDSPDSLKNIKRSRKSRDLSDSEDCDGRIKKKRKKKKKKKSSRNDSDESSDRKKKKRKRSH